MKRREDEKVLLIAETYWLESIALVQDPAASYLLDLADKKKIEIAVPEYSFYEADGSLNRKLIKRAEKIDDTLSLLGQISQSGHSAELCKRGRAILKELKEMALSDKNEINYAEIREELETRGVELVIDSGTCIEKVIK